MPDAAESHGDMALIHKRPKICRAPVLCSKPPCRAREQHMRDEQKPRPALAALSARFSGTRSTSSCSGFRSARRAYKPILRRWRDSATRPRQCLRRRLTYSVLFGWVSDAELYWWSPRPSRFQYQERCSSRAVFALKAGRHLHLGQARFRRGLLWAPGFRSFHVALELDVAHYFADGTFGEDGNF